jgi:CDP-paratose 2-epimerase
MATAIITGSGGLIGSESARFFAEQGLDVIGLENDLRAHFFGSEASTRPTSERLVKEVDGFRWEQMDIRDREGVMSLMERHAPEIELIVRTAAQPSHDWAASDPQTDFTNVSMIEAIGVCEEIAGRKLECALSEQARLGDHRRWISDLAAFKTDYREWRLTFGIEEVLRDIYERNVEQWAVGSR